MAEITTKYLDDAGQEQSIDTNTLAQSMAKSGYQVTHASPDGQELTLQDEKGQFKMHVHDVLQALGYKAVSSMPKPESTNYGGVNLGHRMAVSELPDDDAKKAYIEAKVKRAGIVDPKVIGEGRDWFYFDPDKNQYVALTHSPHWDMKSLGADLGEVLPVAAHTIGAVGGGALAGMGGAAAGGFGAIPAAAAGAAAGGAAAEGAVRGGLALHDEDYRNALSLGEQLKEIGLSAAPDAALVGGGGLLAKGARGVLGPTAGKIAGMIARGPGSTLVRGAGEGAAALGDVARGGGKALAENPALQELGAALTPGVSTVQMAGNLMRLPGQAVTMVPRGLRALSRSKGFQGLVGEENAAKLGSKMTSALEGLPQSEEARAALAPDFPNKVQGLVSKGYQKIGLEKPTQEVAETKNVLANLFRGGAEETNSLIQSAGHGPVNAGLDVGKAEAAGARLGRGLQKLDNAGAVLDKAATGTMKGAGRGLQGLGNAAYYGGKGAATAGQIAQPLEGLALGQVGSREVLNPKIRKDFDFYSEENALRRAKERRRDETFAYMPTTP